MFDLRFDIKETDGAGPRNAIVKGYGWKMPIPNRILTSTEINSSFDVQKTSVPEFTYPHECVEIRKGFDSERLQRVSRYNSDFVKELSVIKKYTRPYNFGGRFVFFRVSRNLDTKITLKNNETLMSLQAEAGLPTISVHEESRLSSAENLSNRLEISKNIIDDARKTLLRSPFIEPLVILSGSCDDSYEFEKKLRTAVDHDFKIICIENPRSLTRYSHNFTSLKGFVAKHPELLVIGSNTSKSMINKIASGPHIMNLFGEDVLGLSMPRPYFNQGEETYQPPWFDKPTGGNLPRHIQEEKYGENLNCTCPVCLNKSRAQFYGYSRVGLLSSACKVHETIDSRELFAETRENIGGLKRFIPKKQYIFHALAKLGMDFRQNSLRKFMK